MARRERPDVRRREVLLGGRLRSAYSGRRPDHRAVCGPGRYAGRTNLRHALEADQSAWRRAGGAAVRRLPPTRDRRFLTRGTRRILESSVTTEPLLLCLIR